jgi:PKD repeat protein
VHVYLDIPQKPVRLTVANANGCKVSSKVTMNSIFSAQFEAEETKLCAPGIVQFNALSNAAVSWQWDFGDGNTSIEANPVHVYQQAGNYAVQLIAGNSSGCSDTVYFENYIKVLKLNASFTLAEQINSACVPVQVSFDNESIGASSYHWDFGDGNTSKVANPLHYYTSVGKFDVRLVVSNSFGCKDTLIMPQMIITKGPETRFSIESKTICMPNAARFTDESTNAVEWQWFFGDGTTSNEQNPEHTYTNPGIYKVTLRAKNLDGCQQSYSIDKIKILPTPVVDFDISISGECYPVEVQLNNKSTSLQNSGFTWDFGNGVKSSEKNPIHTYTKPGTYQISLTVKNESACEQKKTHDFVILVRDTTTHKEADVKTVWVEKNIARFDVTPYFQNNVSHYNVFRKYSSGFKFLSQFTPSTTGVFEDKTCEPQNMSHEYAFQAVSYCDDTVDLNTIKHYNTLYLQREKEAVGRLMLWNKHIGLTADNYRVFRKSENEEEWSEIAVSNIATHNFADSTELCPGIYEYKVAAFSQNRLLSSSNPIKFEVTDAVFRAQQAEIKTTTVLEEGEVFTEWKVPEAGKNRIAAYTIYRSVNDGSFEFYAEVSPKDQFFIDKDVDSKSNKYEYQVKIINDCSIEAPISNKSNTVLLQKQNQFQKYELNWNPYQGWEEGVLKYIIQKKNGNGQWETVLEVSGDTYKAIIKKEDQ